MDERVEGTAVFDHMAEAVACYERDGTIRYVNPPMSRILGRAAEDLVGANVWRVFPEASRKPFHVAFERAVDTGEPQHFEQFLEPSHRWFDNQIWGADGSVWLLARDITEQKLAAARLETLSTASRVFAEAVDDPLDTIVRHLAAVIGDTCSIRLLSPDRRHLEPAMAVWDDDPAIRELLKARPMASANEAASAEILRTGKPVVVAHIDPQEAARRLAPSELRDVVERMGVHSAMVVPLRARGELLGLLGICRRRGGRPEAYGEHDLQLVQELADRAALVVDQWQATNMLEESRHRLLVIGDALPVLVSLIDRQGRYRFVNATYTHWFGASSSEVMGKTVAEMLGPAAYAVIEPYVQRAMGGETVTFEAHVPYAVGGARDIQATYTPYRVGGRIEGFVALVADDSERARLMDDLRHAVEARDEFLSIASHELRTPLTALQLQLDGLQRSFDGGAANGEREKIRNKLGVAVRQTDRLTVLIDGMLSVSSIATDRFRLELEEFDLVRLLRQVLGRFEEEAHRAGSTVTLRGGHPVIGRWDRNGIDQALTNILANALKYGAGQPIEVDVRTAASEVTVTVRDRGIGIAHDDLSRIFERFERAVSSDHYGGFGLGLYITEQIVRAHGGTIEADSRPGEGASFTITLPRWTIAEAANDRDPGKLEA